MYGKPNGQATGGPRAMVGEPWYTDFLEILKTAGSSGQN